MQDSNHPNDKSGFSSYILYFPIILIYLELVFHLLINNKVGQQSLFVFLLPIPLGLLITVITRLFNEKVNKILTWFFTILFPIIFIVHLIYYRIFRVYLSVYSIGAVGTDALQFTDTLFAGIKDNLLGIFLLLIPIIALFFSFKEMDFKKNNTFAMSVTLLSGILLQLVLVLLLPILGKDTYSPYDLYHYTWEQRMSVESLGLMPTQTKDIIRFVSKDAGNSIDDIKVPVVAGKETDESKKSNQGWKNSTKPLTNPVEDGTEKPDPTPTVPTPPPIDTSPNVLDIDFGELAASETNANIKTLHQYFDTLEPTRKNKYTGMFEGYNLIFITAEGFSPFAVNKEVTPTLDRLTNEGFVFNNFYTPLWWASTIDGEYVAQTGLIPKAGVISFYETQGNYMPFAFGNVFTELGYNTKAYHNHTYTYYKRDKLYPNMGYVDYTGIGNGLELTNAWPRSDLEMMEVTVPDYINDQPFHIYYLTVSGHMNYTFAGNNMAAKNRELVDYLPYSNEAKAYIACNIELDKALEKLIQELEEKNIADKTVIAISSDHYPYGLEKQYIDELAGHKVEENFELYKNHFILWSGSIEEPIVIDKASSSLDIIPTLSNLFGIDYDSRLFAGKDALSDSDPLVVFSNRSFITDKIMYNSQTKEITSLTGEEISQEYIDSMKDIVRNRFVISENILDLDYYNHIGLDKE